ncbi:hypothetical protein NB713_000783 [Xanthomonas sacchari]|nr:hypothetical protein [Xanthomonas sacchari]
MRQRAHYPLALARGEARLQQPDLLHRQRETPWQRHGAQLVQGHPVGGAALRLLHLHALLLQGHQRAAVGRPQQQREQERRRHRFVVGDAVVGVAQAFDQHPPQRAAAVGAQRRRALREQRGEQTVPLQALEAGHAMAGQEQLEHFLEQPRRRGLGQQPGQPRDRLGGAGLDLEIELGRQAHRTQHAHRVLAVALLGVADQLHQPRLHILEAADVVAHREVLDGVVQGVAGEVAAHRIVLDAAVDVVADQAAVVHLAVAAAVVDVGAEGGDLDDLAAVDHVGQAEAAADQATVAEQLLDLLGGGVGGDVEILGLDLDQQVADRAADQVGAEAGLAQPVQHAQGVGADVLARDGVLIARDRTQGEWRWNWRIDDGASVSGCGIAEGRRDPYTSALQSTRPNAPFV